MIQKPEDWGMKWEPFIKYAGDFQCSHCNFGFIGRETSAWWRYIVGFSSSSPKSSDRPVLGMVILDCPKCQTKVWIHLDE